MEYWVLKGRNLILFDLHPSNSSFHLSIIPLFQLGEVHNLILTEAPRAKKSSFDYHNAGKLSRNFCKIKGVHPWEHRKPGQSGLFIPFAGHIAPKNTFEQGRPG